MGVLLCFAFKMVFSSSVLDVLSEGSPTRPLVWCLPLSAVAFQLSQPPAEFNATKSHRPIGDEMLTRLLRDGHDKGALCVEYARRPDSDGFRTSISRKRRRPLHLTHLPAT